jgi:UDP-N-acetylglucosamine/UDP-N-acetylgalactosamine 4-epimerase
MSNQKYNVLVTGGAGFIGSNLVEALLKDERVQIVRVLDDFSNGKHKNLEAFKGNSRLEVIEGDIRNFATCVSAMKGMHLISHQAALGSVPRSIEDPLATHHVNITGTANIFTAAKEEGIKKIVYASSSSVYGDSETLPKLEEHKGNLLSPYAMSKSIAEQYASMYALNYGMTFIGFRYFNIFGPKQDPEGPYAAVVPLFLNALIKGEQPKIFGNGQQSRDFTFVSNAVQANLLGLFKPTGKPSASIYNIACGFRTTVNELWNDLSTLAKSSTTPVYLPVRAGDIAHSLADISKARKELSFAPEALFQEGLKSTYDWFINEYK